MVVKERNKNNLFVNLLNFRTKDTLFEASFTDIGSQHGRLEYFLSVRGVYFIDDTRAQSVNAIWYSLESVSTQVTLILHDTDNLEELLTIRQLLMLKVKSIVFLTSPERHYISLLRPLVGQLHYAETMEKAVDWAYKHTEKEDAVLCCGGQKIDIAEHSYAFRNAVRGL